MRKILGYLVHVWQTTVHKAWVALHLWRVLPLFPPKMKRELMRRALFHDLSKYGPDEALWFASVIFELKKNQYYSPEYQKCLDTIRPAIEHHYKHNSHHAQFYPDGYAGMSFADKVEMIADWCAAVKRTPDGNVFKSIDVNQKRFGYDNREKRLLTVWASLMTSSSPLPS